MSLHIFHLKVMLARLLLLLLLKLKIFKLHKKCFNKKNEQINLINISNNVYSNR
jgi:hypothetical protein